MTPAQQTQCPLCHAEPGDPCEAHDGVPLYGFHSERRRFAENTAPTARAQNDTREGA